MSDIKSEKNSTVVLRTNDENEKTIRAAILNYDRARHIITIADKNIAFDDTSRVSMLILEEDTILECQGVVRKQHAPGQRDIAIFNIKSKEGRSAIRYNINALAVIENVILEGKVILLNTAIPVTVENISTNGVLINTNASSLNINSSFQLKINIAGNDVLVNTSVVRIEDLPNGERKLGCKFVSLSE